MEDAEIEPTPTVKLYANRGFRLIIDYPSGVFYSNQTGGFSILFPEIEGIYIPLKNNIERESLAFRSPELELYDYFWGPKHRGVGATDGLDREDADFIDTVLEKWKLSDSLKVDRERLKESHEAWVYVTVLGNEGNRWLNSDKVSGYELGLQSLGFDSEKVRQLKYIEHLELSIFSGFEPYPRAGILTWRNTD